MPSPSKLGFVGRRLMGSVGLRLTRSSSSPPVIVVSAGLPLSNRFGNAVESALQRVVPQLERDDRIGLVERVQSNSQWNFDFFALMSLSTVIAAMGLIQNSPAVVIGAMLVAPLMTPLLGLGTGPG